MMHSLRRSRFCLMLAVGTRNTVAASHLNVFQRIQVRNHDADLTIGDFTVEALENRLEIHRAQVIDGCGDRSIRLFIHPGIQAFGWMSLDEFGEVTPYRAGR